MKHKAGNEQMVATTMIPPPSESGLLVSLHACRARHSQDVFVKICLAFCLQGVQGSRARPLRPLPVGSRFPLGVLASARHQGPGAPPPHPGLGPRGEKTAPTSSFWLLGDSRAGSPPRKTEKTVSGGATPHSLARQLCDWDNFRTLQ